MAGYKIKKCALGANAAFGFVWRRVADGKAAYARLLPSLSFKSFQLVDQPDRSQTDVRVQNFCQDRIQSRAGDKLLD